MSPQIRSASSVLPVASVPTGLATNSVPTGLQIAGEPYEDLTVAEVAGAFASHMADLPYERLLASGQNG